MAAEVRVSPTVDEFWILLSMLRVKLGSKGVPYSGRVLDIAQHAKG